ncbi:MAG: type II toxin-antitoxin system MqsR family toxin [Rhodospirillales bacterium]|jgi:motility quorum-sensing regulator/GCU-specific mRNA interferase toxin
MEKRRPHHNLARVRSALGDLAGLTMSQTAIRDSGALGYDREGVCGVVRSITASMFYKSMTAYDDHRSWQDVYHVPSRGRLLYIKVQDDIVAEFRLVSFKEK